MKDLQQGDVNLKRLDKLPEEVKPVKAKAGRFILAEGEATGHAHAVKETDNVKLFSAIKDGVEVYYLEVTEEDSVVTHEEHKPILVNPGIWEIGMTNEVDPMENEIRRVAD